MVRLIITLIFLSPYLFAEDFEYPEYLEPVPENTELLFSYELDIGIDQNLLNINRPVFWAKKNDSEIVIVYHKLARGFSKRNHIIILTYNTKTNEVSEKEPIPYFNNSISRFSIRNNVLHLYSGFMNSLDFSLIETTINLDTYQPITSRLYFTTIMNDEFDSDDYFDDIDYAQKDISENVFISEASRVPNPLDDDIDIIERFEIFNPQDSSTYNILELLLHNNQKIYARITSFDANLNKKNQKLHYLNDVIFSDKMKSFMSKDELEFEVEDITVNYVAMDNEDNSYFTLNILNEDAETNVLSLCSIDKSLELKAAIKELPFEIDGDVYQVQYFKNLEESNNHFELFGFSENEDEIVTGLYILNYNKPSNTLTLQEKIITEDEGVELNQNTRLGIDGNDALFYQDEELKIDIISGVYKNNGNYYIMTEEMVKTITYKQKRLLGYDEDDSKDFGNFSKSYYEPEYEYSRIKSIGVAFRYSNLFALDSKMNFLWNFHFDTRAYYLQFGWKPSLENVYFNSILKYQNMFIQNVFLQPEFKNNEVTILYPSKTIEEFAKLKFDLSEGKQTEYTPYFTNFDEPALFPGYLIPLGNNEYAGLSYLRDVYLFRFRMKN